MKSFEQNRIFNGTGYRYRMYPISWILFVAAAAYTIGTKLEADYHNTENKQLITRFTLRGLCCLCAILLALAFTLTFYGV